ncbi:MAG TPA: winged helix-turn-helix domain-containing protein [Bryobacteraceae bacterium]|nr:winged helix-turn-helix domain-containing protein [Bryobacteraceae bacterium]
MQPSRKTVRFGAFEVDLSAGELRKHGVRLRLQEQPFQVLVALLERPGEMVSREELVKRLWPDGNFVDFDRGLNAAVTRLRQALSDSAAEPRYVETVARRGYRLIIAPIGEEAAPPPPAVAPRQRSAWAWPVVFTVIIASIGAAVGWRLTRAREEPPRVETLSAFTGQQDYASFSPDGNQVVFSWNGEQEDNWDLYVKMIGSAHVLRLTTDRAPDLLPAWSPGGQQIAFIRRGLRAGIYLISPLGGPEQKVTEFDAPDSAPSWSPDSKFLAVAKTGGPTRTQGAGSGALFLVRAMGGDSRLLLPAGHGQWLRDPAFSPDGRTLAYASCGGDPALANCDVYLVSLNGDLVAQGKPRQLTATGRDVRGITWSQDGRSLVYCTRSPPRGYFLFRVAVTGRGSPELLELMGQGGHHPAVSRQGNRLVFTRLDWHTEVSRLQMGNKPQPFLVSGSADQGEEFSPDGSRIVFLSGRAGAGLSMWLANADGSHAVEFNGTGHMEPRWSPDGRMIASATATKDGTRHVEVVELSDGRHRQLGGGPFTGMRPAWSRDGKWVYFGSDRTGRFEIWRVPFEDGKPEQITRSGGLEAVESVDAKTLYYLKREGAGPLFSQPLGGGPERQIVDLVLGRGFTVFADGIYYLSPIASGKSEIRFHEFATGHSSLIGTIENRVLCCLSVSPDRKTFLYSDFASSGNVLMLVKNFR